MKKIYHTSAIILCISLTAVFSLGFINQDNPETYHEYVLSYRQSAGSVNSYTLTISNEAEINAPGQQFTVVNDVSGNIQHTISKVTGDKISHELLFTSLTIDVSNNLTGSQSVPTDDFVKAPLKFSTGKHGENSKYMNINSLRGVEGNPVPPISYAFDLITELPGNAVKLNDTWTVKKTLSIDNKDGKAETAEEMNFAVKGFEKKNGFDCVKIIGTGIWKNTASAFARGMDIDVEMENKVTVTGYFAHKEGIFIELTRESTFETAMELPAASVVMDGAGTEKVVLTYFASKK